MLQTQREPTAPVKTRGDVDRRSLGDHLIDDVASSWVSPPRPSEPEDEPAGPDPPAPSRDDARIRARGRPPDPAAVPPAHRAGCGCATYCGQAADVSGRTISGSLNPLPMNLTDCRSGVVGMAVLRAPPTLAVRAIAEPPGEQSARAQLFAIVDPPARPCGGGSVRGRRARCRGELGKQARELGPERIRVRSYQE